MLDEEVRLADYAAQGHHFKVIELFTGVLDVDFITEILVYLDIGLSYP